MMNRCARALDMPDCLRWVLRALLLWSLVTAGAVALAAPARRALLVGVSQLPGQPQADWLQAPRNDVQLMRRTLLAQGFKQEAIQILADGVPGAGMPDAGAIHVALDRMVAQAVPGDFVVLYFSGHGTRVQSTRKLYREPDGMAEMFLARDGVVHDAEVGRWVQALLARGAFVWAIFDTCSATSMTRGRVTATRSPVEPTDAADPIRFRGLAPTELSASTQVAATKPIDSATGASDDAPFVPPARYVAFFASESHQLTPELRLPRRQAESESHGLLTWTISEALRHRPATWRTLFNQVLALYPLVIDELEQRFPTRELPSPVAEGSLDAPLFENAAGPASTQPVWLARRQQTGLVVSAGLLDGARANQAVRISAMLPDGRTQDAAAAMSAAHLSAARAPLPPALALLPAGTSWQVTPQGVPPDVALRVHARTDAARKALSGVSLSYPASILMVASPQEADVIVAMQGSAFVATLGTSGSGRILPDANALRRRVSDLATGHWLNRLMQFARDERSVPLKGFVARLWSRDDIVAQRRAEPLAAQLSPPWEGAAVEIENSSGGSVDLMIVGVTSEGALRPIFPVAPGETNRFERGDAAVPARKRFSLPRELTAAGGALLVLATPARPRSPARLYGISPAHVDELPSAVRGGLDPDESDAIYAVMARW